MVCPDRDRLARLCAGQLTVEEAGALEAHVEQCAACQGALDALARDDDSARWRRLYNAHIHAGGTEEGPRGTEEGPLPGQQPITPGLAEQPAGLEQPAADHAPEITGYAILAEVGRGGMGVVYKARQLGLNRIVALKMILAGQHAGPEDRLRFLIEAETAARLQHPNIVQVHEVGSQGDIPYMVQEFVEGSTLGHQLAGRPQPPRRAAALVAALARAIHYAHQQGIIHRDLKPANILLPGVRGQGSGIGDQESPKITDFGLAKQLRAGQGLTLTGAVLGTPGYMAPEQAQGQVHRLGPGVDIYALGAILYVTLAGRPPFRAETELDTLIQVMDQEPPPLTRWQAAVPRDLETICRKCLAKDPARRYATAADLAEDLEHFLAGEPIRARPAGLGERVWRWARRRPAVAGLLAGIALIFVAGVVGVTLALYQALAARRQETEQRQRAEGAREQAERALYSSNIARAQLEWGANNVAEAEQILQSCQPEHRGWEWHFLHGLAHADLLTCQGHSSEGWIDGVAFSPDGGLLASAGGGDPFFANPGHGVMPGEVIIWDAATGRRLRTLRGHKHLVLALAFHPEGRWLASSSADGTAILWDVRTGQELRTFRGHEGWVGGLAFSPDGRLLATASADRTVRVWDLGSKDPERVLGQASAGMPFDGGRVVFSPNSRFLVSVTRRAEPGPGQDRPGADVVKVWDLKRGGQVRSLEGSLGNHSCVAISPDSRFVAAGFDPGIHLWDLGTGRLLRTLVGHTSWVSAVAFSPDSRYLASTGNDTTVRLWRLTGGQEELILRGHRGVVQSVAFDPDGLHLVSGGRDGLVKVWDLTADREHGAVRIQDPQGLYEPESIAFAGAGHQLVVARRGGDVLTLDAATSTLLAECRVGLTSQWMTPAEPACLDPDGRWLAGVSQQDSTAAAVWDVAGGQVKVILKGHHVPVRDVTVTSGGQRVATAGFAMGTGGSVTGELKVWDAGSGQPLFQLTQPGLRVSRLALSPAGDRLAVVGTWNASGREIPHASGVHVYEIASSGLAASLPEVADWLTALTFGPDGRHLAAAGWFEQTVVLWDLDTGRTVVTHSGPRTAHDVAFSPAGRRLAVAGRPMVKLLDAASGEPVLVLRGPDQTYAHDAGFNARVRFSADGRSLAAIGGDGPTALSLWRLDEPQANAEQSRYVRRRAVVRHLHEVGACSHEKNNPALLFHLDQLRTSSLFGPREYARRGWLGLQAGRWREAADDFARLVGSHQGEQHLGLPAEKDQKP